MPIPVGTIVTLRANKGLIGVITEHKKDKEEIFCTVKWFNYDISYNYLWNFDILIPLE